MINSNKTYVKTLPRHVRIIFFIDQNISEESMRRLIDRNIEVWGGRYNPIIPVVDNLIPEIWLRMMAHFDPDYIYYSKTVDVLYLKELGLFFPLEYRGFDTEIPVNLPMVPSYCLLNDSSLGSFAVQHSILSWDGDGNLPIKAKSFYKTNFGFRPSYVQEKKWENKCKKIPIHEGASHLINTFLDAWGVYYKSLLSLRHLNSVTIGNNLSWENRRFEWIIYDKKNFFEDLLYFWNRQLFFEPDERLMQVIASADEMEDLLAAEDFGYLIKALQLDQHISVVTISLDLKSLNSFRDLIQKKSPSTRTEIKKLDGIKFPEPQPRVSKTRFLQFSNNMLIGKNDYLKYPIVGFEGGDRLDRGDIAIELIVERDTDDFDKEVLFPLSTELHLLFHEEKARVSRQHKAVILTSTHTLGTQIWIPTNDDLIKSILTFSRNGLKMGYKPIENLRPSNAGRKLSAFLQLLDNNWDHVEELIADKFWLQLFRSNSELPKSNIPKGKGVFSHLDLQTEIRGLYKKHKDYVKEYRERGQDVVVTNDVLDDYIEKCNKEDFEIHIDSNLNYLIKKGGLFIGMKVKCYHCGSNRWYPLSTLHAKFPCGGCNEEVAPMITSKIYYRLSDIIVNNLVGDTTKNGRDYDGNYVVLKTLLHLRRNGGQFGGSFIWSPPLDFSQAFSAKPLESDLDIVVIQNGKLIIGECKTRAEDFSKSVIQSLIWLGNNICPDKLIIACKDGSLETKVAAIKNGLTNKNCEIISYVVSEPWYKFRGLFGLK